MQSSSIDHCKLSLSFFLGPISGVGITEGTIWSEQRRFMLKSLTDLGMGKKQAMENIIGEEMELLAEHISTTNEQPVDVKVREICKKFVINNI